MEIEEINAKIDEIIELLKLEKETLPDKVEDLNIKTVMELHKQLIKKFNELRLAARNYQTEHLTAQKIIGEIIDYQLKTTTIFALDINPRIPRNDKTDPLSDRLLKGRKDIIGKSIDRLIGVKDKLLALKQQTL